MRFILLILIFFIATPAMAQTPTPSAHPLKDVESKMVRSKEEKKKLQAELKKIESNMSSQRKKLISVAKNIKGNENTLVRLEKNIATKQDEQRRIEAKLTEDKKSISELVLALERIRRIPPEAVMARPDSPLKTAQSTMLLQSILPRVYKRADQLKADLKKLDELIVSLEEDRNKAIVVAKKLQKDQKSLSHMLTKRETIYARTEKDIERQKSQLKAISQQASSLKELVKKIEAKQRREAAARKKKKKSNFRTASVTNKATPIPKTGSAQLPVSGIMAVGYGKTDDIGAVSQGIKIKSRKNALIVAPMGGVVDYAGKFKGYGQIIILKHQKGYHSLIAGFGKIDTAVGRAVVAGEPIGKMASSGGKDAETLYYELRYKGNPVNPSKKISGLK